MRWNSQLEPFIADYINSANADENELKACLRSVPDEGWSIVCTRLGQALCKEKLKYEPTTSNVDQRQFANPKPWVSIEEDLSMTDLVARKNRILKDEIDHRKGLRH